VKRPSVTIMLTSLLLISMPPIQVGAQGNQGGDVSGSDRQSGAAKGRQAIVGANTTAGTTTGSSGDTGGGGGGPTPPTEDLCRTYEKLSAHADCLAKITKR